VPLRKIHHMDSNIRKQINGNAIWQFTNQTAFVCVDKDWYSLRQACLLYMEF
jgi:hypothetical protein